MTAFLDLLHLSPDSIRQLVSLARELEGRKDLTHLKHQVVGLLFMNPSLRTLVSMQTAVAHLGGTSVVIQPGQGSWKLELRDGVVMDGDAVEHIREAMPVLAQYVDLLGVRCFAEGKSLADDLADQPIRAMADHFGGPFVNLESAASHPCQALADWKTLDDLGIPANGKFVLSWAYHPKPLPFAVPQSALTMALLRGMEVTVLRPPGFDLPGGVISQAVAAAAKGGGTFHETADCSDALEGAHVLYAKSWAKPDVYGDPEADRIAREPYRDWTVDESWFAPARPEAKFMHCLPVRRNIKVTDAVLDGPRSIVVAQAGNRLHAQKAILAALSEGGLR
jgi:N-acetylornithine carbamoyltransferase